jgi:hypothetical protein
LENIVEKMDKHIKGDKLMKRKIEALNFGPVFSNLAKVITKREESKAIL